MSAEPPTPFPPILVEALEHFRVLGALASELGRILGVRFVPGEAVNDAQIGLTQRRALQLWNAGRKEESRWEVMRLAILVEWLTAIEQHDPAIIQSLRPRLLARDVSAYFGAHHEAKIGAGLLRRGLAVRHEAAEGSPDYEVLDAEGNFVVGVECTSAHIPESLATPDNFQIEPSEPAAEDPSYRIARRIRSKARKPYARSDVVLSIDTTNIEAVTGSDQASLDQAIEALEESGFGSLLVYASVINLDGDEPELTFAYRRRDASTIAPRLRAFLDTHFPTGKFEIEKFATSRLP